MLCLSLISLFTLFSLIFSVFFSDFPVFPDPLVRTKTFSAHNKSKTATTCAENVLTLTPECFHRHVFLLPLHSSLISAFSLYSVFYLISLFSLTLPCVLKRFPLTTSRKTTTTYVENVLTLTPECFHRHVFLLPLHSSLISAFSLYSVFYLISLFSLTLPCVLKRFPLTTSRKTTTTYVENVLTLTPDHAEHDVLPLTPTPEFPPQDKPGRWRGHGGMVAHDLVNGCQATA